jgi:AraC-like DNA-binding protein
MLMAIRLWRAKAFLTHGMPAAEVAIAVGLTDQSHLTRAFTRVTALRRCAIRSRSPALMRNLIQYSRPASFYTADNSDDNGCNDD